mgnify:CR=1 FL=1
MIGDGPIGQLAAQLANIAGASRVIMAGSWDEKLGEAVGEALGEEAAAQEVAVLLGPGLNIQRSPLCGRDFEYFSEDPILAGRWPLPMCAASRKTASLPAQALCGQQSGAAPHGQRLGAR